MKEKFSKEYLWRLKLILRSKENGRNKIIAVNTWRFLVMRYNTEILKWNTDKLKSLDRRNRKIMRYIRVYLNREMGGRRLINCEGSVRMKKKPTWDGMPEI